jgi:hypothetical protein
VADDNANEKQSMIMNIKDQIRAEIDRLKSQLIRGACAAQIEMETNCKNEAYNEVRAFLDTLPEQPVEELEEEIKKYFDGWGEIGDGDSIITKDSDYVGLKDLPNIARHFAEWGAEHLKK